MGCTDVILFNFITNILVNCLEECLLQNKQGPMHMNEEEKDFDDETEIDDETDQSENEMDPLYEVEMDESIHDSEDEHLEDQNE